MFTPVKGDVHEMFCNGSRGEAKGFGLFHNYGHILRKRSHLLKCICVLSRIHMQTNSFILKLISYQYENGTNRKMLPPKNVERTSNRVR